MDIHRQQFSYKIAKKNWIFDKKYTPHFLVVLFSVSVLSWWYISAIDHARQAAVADVESEQKLSIADLKYQLAAKQETNINETENLNEMMTQLEIGQTEVANLEQEIANLNEKQEQLKNEIQSFEKEITAKQEKLKSLNFPKGQYITVILSDQNLIVFEDAMPLKKYDISSGAKGRSTPVGNYKITNKYPFKTYVGADYYYPNTKWNMRYNGPYLIHTAWWHNDFGTPVSHGCINMKEEEAEWLYNWVKVGTPLKIHK